MVKDEEILVKLEEVETVYLGIFERDFVIKVGGYDETNLQWAA